MRLVPYLSFNGNCEEALNFYKKNLNGKILAIQRFGDAPMNVPLAMKKKVLHSSLQFGDNIIMASDSIPKNKIKQGNGMHLSIDVKDVKTINAVFKKMSAGGKVTMPLQDTFWGARFGMLVDKYGISWMFNCDKKK
jgi:PhnB protein